MSIRSLISPSGSGRWMKCPASVPLSAALPSEKVSEAALEGTAAHMFAAEWLTLELATNKSVEPDSIIGKSITINDHVFTLGKDIQLEYLTKYINLILLIIKHTNDARVFIENPIPLLPITSEDNTFGTPDCILISDDKKILTVVDLKFGSGVPVSAYENTQLIMYGLAAIDYYKFFEADKIRLIIVQPKIDFIDEYEIEYFKFAFYREQFRKAAQRCGFAAISAIERGGVTKIADEFFNPGTIQCRWCNGKAICPAINKEITKAIEISTEPVKSLSEAYKKVGFVENWCKAVKEKAMAILETDGILPGLALVKGKNLARKWESEEALFALAKEENIDQSLLQTVSTITPPEVERRVEKGHIPESFWDKIQKIIIRPQGKPVIVETKEQNNDLIEI